MYNARLKTAFIRSYTQSINTASNCEAVFNLFEPYEIQWGGDLCTREPEELQPVVNQLVGLRAKSKWTRLLVVKAYSEWCIQKGVPGATDGISRTNIDSLEIIRTRMVANPVHMQRYLNEVFETEDQGTVDNIYRCYYWMAYGGFNKDDILKVKISDVNFEAMTVDFGNKSIPIYREALPAFRFSVEAKEFLYKHPKYSEFIYKDRAPGNILIRGITPETDSDRVARVIANYSLRARHENKTKIQMSYYRAWLSGLFYRMYEMEKAGYSVDFTQAALEYMGDKVYKLDSGRNTPAAKMRRVRNEYTEDYDRWKLAFSM